MARRKKTSGGELVIGGLILLGVMLTSIPREVWVLIGILIGIGAIIYLISLFTSSKKISSTQRNASSLKATANRAPDSAPSHVSVQIQYGGDPAAIPVAKQAPTHPRPSFSIPPAPKGFGAAKWIPAGESVTVAGASIQGGMIYVGSSLSSPSASTDPCLINPSLSVAAHGDYTTSGMGYWPSYSAISNSERRAYLDWLAGGRSDPEADVGYVFLFFYGLERRVLIDEPTNSAIKAELQLIAAELRRLIGIYGERSHSMRRYASGLLDWVELADHSDKLYLKPIPDLPRTHELPVYLRLALGQAAIAAAPVPSTLALAWVKHDPTISLRTPATRCPQQFDALFQQKYTEAFGAGLVLPRNRTKLKFVYRPASAGFMGKEFTRTFGEVPDVTAATGSAKKLQQVVEETTKVLESFSRFVGKTPEAADTIEAHLLLPITLWPEAARSAVEALRARMDSGMVLLTYEELLAALGAQTTLARDKIQALARTLESTNIGFEPDVLAGAKMPKPESHVVLFALPPGEVHSRTTPAHQVALLTLQMAAAVATADGEFSSEEMNHLREQVESWSHLTPNHQRRLSAHLLLLTAEPMSLAALKKKLEPLSQSEKESIASFMATVAQSDGTVSPEEVKFLERLYKALGIESHKVFSDLHAVATGIAATSAKTEEIARVGFALDPARIAELQQDTQKVSALLSTIFTEPEAVPAVASEEPEESGPLEDEIKVNKSILGLDDAHSAFARLLLSRPQWRLDELEDAAADLDLMLSGALEQLNEAAYDTYDIPFTEGDDPIEIGAEIVEKLEA